MLVTLSLCDYHTIQVMDPKEMEISPGISCWEKEKAPAKGETQLLHRFQPVLTLY